MSAIEWSAMQAAYAQGFEEGREEVCKEDAVKLLALGVEPEKISEAMGFSVEELMDLLGPTAT